MRKTTIISLSVIIFLLIQWYIVHSNENYTEPLNISDQRQLFVDNYLIDHMDNVRLMLHRPIRREAAIRNDYPWENYGVSYMVTFRDSDIYRAWYRCDAASILTKGGKRACYTGYAESKDGINWKKPKLLG